MTNHTKTILIALATVSVALAGCTSDGDDSMSNSETDSAQDQAPVRLGNQGAITGLVVDDNFRPVQLKEAWEGEPGEYQDQGFVLILETAQRFETNENGEFQVVPMDPGTYTLRVAADNHEAIDQTVTVVAGEYAEVTLEARRTYSEGGTVFSKEEVLFMACYGNFYFFTIALASVENNGCGDLSGDSSRFDFWTDQPELAPDLRGIVTEMRANQEWDYSVVARLVGDGGTLEDGETPACNPYCEFSDVDIKGGVYLHNVLYPELQFEGPGEYLEDGQAGYCKIGRESVCDTYAFTMEWPFQTALFTSHPTSEYTAPTCGPTQDARDLKEELVGGFPPTGCGGVGVALGIKAQFLQNMFLYELPEEGIESYCALCEDADIPQ